MQGEGGWRRRSGEVQQRLVEHSPRPQPQLRRDHVRVWGGGQGQLGVGRRSHRCGLGGCVTGGARPPWVTLTPRVAEAAHAVPPVATRVWAGVLLRPAPLVTALAVGGLAQVHQLQGSCRTVS